jgi:hypothetical protein
MIVLKLLEKQHGGFLTSLLFKKNLFQERWGVGDTFDEAQQHFKKQKRHSVS